MSRLNIVLLLCDDLGYGDTGFAGHPRIETPHLDALCADGMRLTRFAAGGPVCSPTRGTCLTGRHYVRYGITHANQGRLPAKEVTLAQVLQQTGYRTGHFGKWHLGCMERDWSGKKNRDPARCFAPPWERHYHRSLATEFAVPTWDPGRAYNMRTGERSDEPWLSPYYLDGERIESPLGCDSAFIVDHACTFIDEAIDRDQPFFTTVWFHAPHTPVEAGPEYLARYADCDADTAHYYGCVTAMDAAVGRLVDHLKATGQYENTIIWFASDNGPEGKLDLSLNFRSQGSTGGLRGRKRSLYNGGVLVPALVRWPGVTKPGSTCPSLLSTLDYLPTTLAALGIDHPAPDRPLDGEDVQPVLRGERTRQHPVPFRFLEAHAKMFGSPTLALYTDTFKYLTNLSDDGHEDQLFAADDHAEDHDICADHSDTVKIMRDQLQDFMTSCRASHGGADYAFDPVTDFQEPGAWRDRD